MKKNILIAGFVVASCFFSASMSKGVYTFENGKIVIGYNDYIQLRNNLSLHINDDVVIKNVQNYYFNNENCYFVDLVNEENKEYSVIMNSDISNFKIYIIFNDDSSNYIDSETANGAYDEDNISLASSSSSTLDYSTLGVVFDNNIISSSKYFTISNIGSKRTSYASSYLNEVKINDVPNYMNTMYNGNGCVPTTAAMYFAYLEDNGYSTICGGRNLPVSHTDNTSLVNSYITYLGDNYFNTDNSGTYRSQIPGGYDDYLDDVGCGSYYTEVSKNYNEFYNSIYNCGLPVPISIQATTSSGSSFGHAVLGIGARSLFSNNTNTYYITANYVSNSEMEVVSFSVDLVRQFYFIHK